MNFISFGSGSTSGDGNGLQNRWAGREPSGWWVRFPYTSAFHLLASKRPDLGYWKSWTCNRNEKNWLNPSGSGFICLAPPAWSVWSSYKENLIRGRIWKRSTSVLECKPTERVQPLRSLQKRLRMNKLLRWHHSTFSLVWLLPFPGLHFGNSES